MSEQESVKNENKNFVRLSKEIVESRNKKFEELKEKYLNEIIGKERIGKPIKVKLPDGSFKDGKSFETRPIDIANEISKGLAQKCIAAKVDGKLWDIGRPFEDKEEVELQLLKYDSEESKHIFWHSSSHILGQALERKYEVLLCNGPPVSDGFYYDSYILKEDGKTQMPIVEKDLAGILLECKKIIKEKQPFERIEVSKKDALELFAYNPFKVENISDKVKEGENVSVYRCGNLIDPCTGPHLLHTGKASAFDVSKNSSAYWRADENREVLQRVYGVSFPDKKLLKEHLALIEEMKKRSHKYIGKQQELWFMHPFAPGMFFFAPYGAKLYNNLVKHMRAEQRKRGYVEVHTPNMYHQDLFLTSGHWQNYQEDMFVLKVDNAEHALKPMNCPGHCIVYAMKDRSYRDLPIRMAEYGVLHRNERRGALTGMTRVRRFVQDDAHIFCRPDQIEQEVMGCLEFMDSIYTTFNFKVKLFLATRPEKKCIGSEELWKTAESQIESCLKRYLSGKGREENDFEIDVGGGAFYGPKIDIHIEDSMKRLHQTATVQLDFNLPERFGLDFKSKGSGDERPVMVHRAIFGSIERFLSIFTEHCGGKWPFWVSPRQIIILPVSKRFFEYGEKLQKMFEEEGFSCEFESSNKKIQKKIREAQLAQWNYMLIVGQQEVDAFSANVRVRDQDKPLGMKKVDDLMAFFKKIMEDKPFNDPQSLDKVKEEEE